MKNLCIACKDFRVDLTKILKVVSPAKLHIDRKSNKVSVDNIDDSVNIKEVYDAVMDLMMKNTKMVFYNSFSVRIDGDNTGTNIYTLFENDKAGTIVFFNDIDVKLSYGYNTDHTNGYMFVSKMYTDKDPKYVNVPAINSHTGKPIACNVSPYVIDHWGFIKDMVMEYAGIVIEDNPPEDLC